MGFKIGDEVRITEGLLAGETAVIIDPFWQVSQSDYPEVIVRFDSGETSFVDIDYVELIEDPYEYRIYMYSEQGFWFPLGDGWWALELMKEDLERREDEAFRYSTGKQYKIMRRRKAGEAEDFDE